MRSFEIKSASSLHQVYTYRYENSSSCEGDPVKALLRPGDGSKTITEPGCPTLDADSTGFRQTTYTKGVKLETVDANGNYGIRMIVTRVSDLAAGGLPMQYPAPANCNTNETK